MRRHSLRPNLLTLNTLLIALVNYPSSHSVHFCNELLDDAIKLGLAPNTMSFNILINGHCLKNKFRDAIRLLYKMEEFGCRPDNVSYNTVLDGLSKKGRLKEIRELLVNMKNKGLVPNKNTYNILVSGYCRIGLLKDAAQKLGPDSYTYNAIVEALTNVGRIREAEEFTSKMIGMRISSSGMNKGEEDIRGESSSVEQEDMSSIAQSKEINELCAQGRYKDAMHIFGELTQKGVFIPKSTYITLMYGLISSQSGSSPDSPNPSGSAIYFSYNSKSDFSYALKSDFIYSYGGTDNQRSLQSISATTENSDGISEPQISESVIHSVLKADKAGGKTAKRPVQKAKPGGGGGNANRELRKICSKTEKPSLCVSTIAPRLRGGGANPRAVLDICIKASYDLAKSGAAKVKKLGVKECKGKFNDALSNFDLATKAFQKKDVGTMNSMLSAVVTDMSDCQDKLSGSGSPLIALGDKLATMTSNCLLIIPQMN
nr:pentatricopeptide repeat-containing protein At2g16880 [Ipomoea batatas]